MNPYINNVSWGISLVLRQGYAETPIPTPKNNEILISASVNGYTL